MGLAYVATAQGSVGSGSSVSTSSTLNVKAGDLIVAYVRWLFGATTLTSITDGGSNTCTLETVFAGGAYYWQSLSYILSASANASATFTATIAASETAFELRVIQFRPDAGDTVTHDQAQATGGANSGTSISTSTITTTGDDELVIAGVVGQDDISAWQIGGVNADAHFGDNFYRILTGVMTNGAATATMATSGHWSIVLNSFKSTAAAGGGTTSVQHMMHLARQRRR